jgi:anion-transporting  ArsA/GET3 family ATPase
MAGPNDPSAVFDALARRQLLVVSGKGGVGRTTVAALLGLALARRGRRVLVATVGLDDRLGWMLGQTTLGETPTLAGPNLYVQRVVPQVCVREYGALVLHSERLASAVFDSAPIRRLVRTVPGLDDFAVLGKIWHEAVRARSFDCVVFDGPATGHLRYTLGIPQAILKTVKVGPLPREARLMQDSLEDPARTQAVLVGLPDRWPLTELGEMAQALREELRVGIGGIFVNGLWPELPLLTPPAEGDAQVRAELAATAVVAQQAARQRGHVEAWLAAETAAGRAVPPVIPLPWRWEGFAQAADLRSELAALESRGAR